MLKATYYTLVADWSKYFGAPVNKEPKFVRERTDLAMNLIFEEIKELEDEIFDKPVVHPIKEKLISFINKFFKPENKTIKKEVNLNKVADAIGDSIWVLIRLGQEYGLNSDEILQKIYDSNMSKLCISVKEAQDSIKAYEDKNIKAYFEVIPPYYIIKRSSDNKILKSINFKEPVFNYDNKN